jgi:hypothetical protein
LNLDTIFEKFEKILLYIWQFPQTILALILIKAFKCEKVVGLCRTKDVYVTDSKKMSGISLGEIIILRRTMMDKDTVAHEYGHSIQSLFFGPLYLIIVGIPSAVFNNLWDRLFHKEWSQLRRTSWYYSRYPENWADELGTVSRDKGEIV